MIVSIKYQFKDTEQVLNQCNYIIVLVFSCNHSNINYELGSKLKETAITVT